MAIMNKATKGKNKRKEFGCAGCPSASVCGYSAVKNTGPEGSGRLKTSGGECPEANGNGRSAINGGTK